MKRIFLSLAAVLAIMLGYASVKYPEQLFGRIDDIVALEEPAAPPPRAASAPAAPALQSQEQLAGKPVEEVHESPDSESGLASLLPRQSAGHAQGLDKTQDPLRLSSSAAVVMDADTKNVLYAKNEEAILPLASITKLMMGMVVLDSKLALNESITITEDDVDRERSSRSRMRVGTVLTRDEALHLALMSSENRAAHALARTSPQGLEAFVKAMNHKARQLGMTNTFFKDPTGLSASNHSTAKDLATLTLAASAYPMLREYSTTLERRTPVGNRVLLYRNSDPLVKDSKWDIALQKTGYIIEAGHCVVMRTTLGGKDLVMVLLDSASNGRRSADARKIRQWVGGGNDDSFARKAEPQRKVARKTEPPKKTAVASNGKKQAAKQQPAKKQASKQETARVKKRFESQADSHSSAPHS